MQGWRGSLRKGLEPLPCSCLPKPLGLSTASVWGLGAQNSDRILFRLILLCFAVLGYNQDLDTKLHPQPVLHSF